MSAYDDLAAAHKLFVDAFCAARSALLFAHRQSDARRGCDAVAQVIERQSDLEQCGGAEPALMLSQTYGDTSPEHGVNVFGWYPTVRKLVDSLTGLASSVVRDSDGETVYGGALAERIRAEPARYWPPLSIELLTIPLPDTAYIRFLSATDAEAAEIPGDAGEAAKQPEQPDAYVEAGKLWPKHGFESYNAFRAFLKEYGVRNHQSGQRRMVHAAECLQAIAERDRKAEEALDVAGDVFQGIKQRTEAVRDDSLRRKREEK